MRPMFTVHAGEYLVGEYIDRTYPKWNVWVPSKDTGTDLLVTSANNRKAVALQVKFSKDFIADGGSPLIQSRLLGLGWWTLKLNKIISTRADFWIFVLPSFVEKRASFIIVPPSELLRRLRLIHGHRHKLIQSYFVVTRTKRCWETRGLPKADLELIALDRFLDARRDFTEFLNGWRQIERKMK